MQVNTVIWQL